MDRSKFLNLALAVGKVISTEVTGRARVLIQLNRFNPYINTYFPNKDYLETYNPNDRAKVGDLVLVKKLDKDRKLVETHKIADIIYAAGFVIDPMTGLRVDQSNYLHEEAVDEGKMKKLSQSMKDKEHAPRFSFETSPKDILNTR